MGPFRDPKYRINFELYRKIPEIPWIRIENLEKIPSAKAYKYRNLGNRAGIWKYWKNRENPECEIPNIPKVRRSGYRDFNPGNSGFLESRYFNPRDIGFFLISGFLRNPRVSGFFTSGISRGFFTYYVNPYIILYLLPELSVTITGLKRI